MFKLRYPLVLLLTISIALNIYLVFFASKEKIVDAVSEKSSRYPFLAKRIFLENASDVVVNFVDLRQKLRDYDTKSFFPIGIYFQYLPTGVAIGVNETKPFTSASLLKVPTVMMVYKMIEEGKVKEDQLLEIKEEHLDQGYGDLWRVGAGTKITVKEAIEKSLVESDNTAHNLLYELSGGAPLEVFKYLDIPSQVLDGQAVVTTRNYSSILRSLFFSAYLNFENSNEIIALLTKAKHGEALRADVPEEVKVALKIGVFEQQEGGSANTYGNCGIFYVPNRNYVLCVMYTGTGQEANTKTRDISNMVYDFVKNLK